MSKARDEGLDRRHSIPYNPQDVHAWEGLHHPNPHTPIQALMEAAPGDQIETSQTELLGLRDILQDAIETWLTPEERYVFDAFYIERLTLRQIEDRYKIPKTTVARRRDNATAKLRAVLAQQPEIKEYGVTDKPTTWEDAAYQAAAQVVQAWDQPHWRHWPDYPEYTIHDAIEAVGDGLEALRARVFEGEYHPEFADQYDDGTIDGAYEALAILAIHGAAPKDVPAHVRRVVELIARKQHDYGHNNIARFGSHGLAIRMHDKYARILNLTNQGVDPENESIGDSWDDLLGYAIIGLMWESGTFLLPLRKDT